MNDKTTANNAAPMLERIKERINDSTREINGIGCQAQNLRDRVFGPRDQEVEKKPDPPPPSNSAYQQLLDACIILEKQITMLGKVVDELQQLA